VGNNLGGKAMAAIEGITVCHRPSSHIEFQFFVKLTMLVVMVSSGLGSKGWLSDPQNEFYGVNYLGYNSSKSALNAVTLSFAKELAASGIKVNAADPGFTATDFNGHSGYRTVEQAAKSIVFLATLAEDGPTGGFFFDGETVPW
jgi:NAD(P)-dependent dehydrogenase (short-subunit alcohol dehydrogenase family)